MTVKRLMMDMDIPEMYEWMAYLKIEHDRLSQASLDQRADEAAEAAKRRPR